MNQEFSVYANHFRKLRFPWSWIINIFTLNFLNPHGYADGGKISLTENSIIFKPHFFNAPRGKLTVDLKDIKRVVKNPGAMQHVKNISIFLRDMSEERFVIYTQDADEFFSLLNKKKISAE